jgi:RNA polymerase sigma factor (sigma-70 family)
MLTEQQRSVIEQAAPAVRRAALAFAAKFGLTEIDELMSDANLSIVTQVHRYDPNRGDVGGWAYLYAWWGLRYARRERYRKACGSLARRMRSGDESAVDVEVKPDRQDWVDWEHLTHRLSPRTRQVVLAVVRDGRSQESVGREIGMTQAGVSMMLDRARRYISPMLSGAA